MKLLFLGTGTSVGIPAIGCSCPVCLSGDPRNKRRRASLYLQAAGLHLVVDTPPDFREQMLTFRVPRVDALLFTHPHADHLCGFDDIRRFNEIQESSVPAYGSPETLEAIQCFFHYANKKPQSGVSYPRVSFKPVTGPFEIGAIRVTPLDVEHAQVRTFGYRFDAGGRALAYIPDCHILPDAALAALKGLDVMILDGLRPAPHPTHLTVAQSTALLRRIGARQSFLTHIAHQVEHAAIQAALPPGIDLPYDGLEFGL